MTKQDLAQLPPHCTNVSGVECLSDITQLPPYCTHVSGVECLSDITASSSRTGSDLECGSGSHKKKKHKNKDKVRRRSSVVTNSDLL